MTAANRTLLTLKRDQSASEGAALEERLHKVLANAGLGSRRMLEQRIDAGEIRVNGAAANIGASVRAGDRVELDDRQFMVASDNRSDAEILIYNKPEGVITPSDCGSCSSGSLFHCRWSIAKQHRRRICDTKNFKKGNPIWIYIFGQKRAIYFQID